MTLCGILLQTFLAIVALFVLRTVESQMIEVHPPNIAVQSDEPNVVLGCNVTGLPPSTYIEWIYYPTWHPTGFIIYSTINDINNDLTNFTVYHSPLGNGTRSFELVIKTAKRELATLYMCQLTPISGFQKTIHVVALDKIECPGDIIVYDEGNEANLSCSINFYDSTLTYFPNIMWYKDGQPVSGAYTIIESNNRRTTRLAKNVTSADDNQVFVCMVDFPNSDPDYTDNCSTIFYVRRQTVVSVYPANIGAQRGEQNVVLGCSVTNYLSPYHIVWSYFPASHPTGFTIFSTVNNVTNDQTNFSVNPLTAFGNTYSLDLVIKTVTPELATMYRCELSGTNISKSIQVIVLDKIECPGDIIVYDEGNGANLSCSVNFYDSTLTYFPNIMWYKDGQPISGAYTIIESNNRRTTRLAKNVTSADDNQVFVCMVDFPNSYPDYTDNCSTIFYVRRQTVVSVYPANIGAQRGEQNVVLSCSVTSLWPYHIVWSYFPASHPNGFTIFSTVNNVTNDQTNFSVNPLTAFGNTYSLDLVIKTVTPELATMYRCELSGTNISKSIQVIVLDKIECPGDIIVYDEGNQANLSCSINFYDSTLTYFPNIRWYKDGQPISGAYTIIESNNRRTTRLAKNVTSADGNQVFVCMVGFPNSDPDYTDNCSTIFYVKHKVSEINFYPASSAEFPANVAVGETINCTADGRPEPTIEWYDFDGNLLSQWSELTVDGKMQTRDQPITLYCRARNTLDSGLTFAEVQGNYTFNVVDGGIIVQSIELEAWKLTVAVIVPIVVGLAAIAIAVFLIIQHRKAK